MSVAWPAVDWSMLLLMVPLAAGVLAFMWPRAAMPLGLAGTFGTVAVTLGLAAEVLATGPVRTLIGGWAAPLGIELYADGLSAAMLAMTAVVGSGVALAAVDSFGTDPDGRRQRDYFWPLWMLLLGGMNAVYLSGDLFNLYVTTEVVGLAAVGLTVLSGKTAALRAGLGYLVASLVGSLLFLLGVAFLYAAFGRVDVQGLSAALAAGPASSVALVLMLTGLSLKSALFPLHFWLPAAHANAAAPASALLSGLVVKTSLYIMFRLWFDMLAPVASSLLGTLLAVLGAGAVIWGSLQALRAQRLKLLVAYSTVAQIGLIVLVLALIGQRGVDAAWAGAVCLMLAHAAAKAAMFLASGRIAEVQGHDRIEPCAPGAPRATLAHFAFAIAAVSLIGLPPSGGFIGKWLLTEGAIAAQAWPWVAMIAVGTALSAAYLLRAPAAFLQAAPDESPERRPTPARAWSLADGPPLALALLSIALGLSSTAPLQLLAVGSPFAGEGQP